MAKCKVVLNRAGVRELLRSKDMMDICSEYASAAVSRCGDGFEMSTHVGKNRVNAEIKATTPKAYFKNLKNNVILKSLGGIE